jgi:hypothetical protein
MFSADVQVHDFTAQDWLRLPDLFRQPPSAASSDRAGIVAVRQGGRIVKLVALGKGRLPPPESGMASAEELAREHHGLFAIILSTTALEQLGDRFARRLTREHGFHRQLEAFVGGMRELEREGEVELWPAPFSAWPIPTERALSNALDLVCPEGKSLVIAAFDDGQLYTALCLRRRGAAFDTIMGPDRLRRDIGLLSGDFSRDYRYLGPAVEARVGPLAVGCYAELATFRYLAAQSEPGAWAAAVAGRDVVLTPVTAGLAVPLGVDAGRAAFQLAKGVAARFGVLQGLRGSGIGPALGKAYSFVEGDVRRYLGFDPLRALQQWFRVQA